MPPQDNQNPTPTEQPPASETFVPEPQSLPSAQPTEQLVPTPEPLPIAPPQAPIVEPQFAPTQAAQPQTPVPQPAVQQPYMPQQPQQPTPVPSLSGQPVMTMPQPKKSRKKVLIIAAVAAVVIIGGGAFAAIKLLDGGIPLEKFENDDFSILVPVGYEKEDLGTEVQFSEKKTDEDNDSDTRSGVEITRDEIPDNVTSEQKKEGLDKLEEQQRKSFESEFSSEDEKAKDLKIVRGKFQDNDAIIITSDFTKDGKFVGRIKSVTVIVGNNIYGIFVYAHASDNGLIKSIDKIFNSFKDK